MTTYSDYPRTSLSSTVGEGDFPLYSYSEPSYQGFLQASTYDAYPSQTATSYGQSLEKPGLPSHSPYSPAMSASHSFDMQHFSESTTSGPSTISSAMASPSLSGQHNDWAQEQQGLGIDIVQHDDLDPHYPSYDTESYATQDKLSGCVDPALIDGYASNTFPATPYTAGSFTQSPRPLYANVASPAPSHASMHHHMGGPIRSDSRGPPVWQPYPQHRSQSVVSAHSRHSSGSCESDENKSICPIPSCRRPIRDVKAHMLTHQSERPEKCPIPSCPYHIKGFARKYDKNRHTLTHFKGTMVCDFCPGSGTSSEKSFNRTDVFKRHLQSVHNVEQTTPNSRRRKPIAGASKKGVREIAATCRTCNGTFPSAQDLHDHIDECVLRVVQQTEPSEEINEQLLTSVADDEDVKATMTAHNLPTSLEGPTSFDEGDDDASGDEARSSR